MAGTGGWWHLRNRQSSYPETDYSHSYRIPDEETIRIVKYVSERGMVIPIQVHSHPQEAFHSFADDERAFVQHENAMSIVVPNFANFPISRFLDRALFFRLLAGNRWRELAPKEVGIILRIEAR